MKATFLTLEAVNLVRIVGCWWDQILITGLRAAARLVIKRTVWVGFFGFVFFFAICQRRITRVSLFSSQTVYVGGDGDKI